jgi:spore germination cell wall hydrolase CwlJ-like protein
MIKSKTSLGIGAALLFFVTQSYVVDAQVISDAEYCLALNVYHEARSENLAGKFAVSDVVLNRVNDNRYPDTICGVVKQAVLSKWHLEQGREVPVRNKCQFSWYCDGRKDDPTDMDAWAESRLVAYQMLEGNLYRGITEGATHYHATYVQPSWRTRFSLVGHIGSHIFYRAE